MLFRSVQRPGLRETIARFDWRVASPVSGRSTLVSNRPMGPILTRLAAAAGVALLLLAAVMLLWRRLFPPVERLAEKVP